ncbi:unnamed protein product [Rhizoctonia solani]|uniref:Uncharacterized protein n=1 Tax=Rhizoctonia solani TaxID=456999 RepID=A0A8H3C8X5_9AGAM|nr:unnamed protein product [Rhizoctonia solani]
MPNQQAQLWDYPPFELKYCKKPRGTAGKGPPNGYNLQDASGLSTDHHAILNEIVESELRATPGINMHATIENQEPKSLVGRVILSIAEKYTEFKIYEDDDHWLLRAYVYTVLKNSKGRFLRDRRIARTKMDPAQLELEESKRAKAKENAKARGQASARARKAKREAAEAAAAALVTPTEAQAAAPVEAQAATNELNQNAAVPVVHEVLDDEVEIMAHNISMMSINIPSSGEEPTDTDDGDFVLPGDISGSAPTTQDLVTTLSTPLEAPPVSSALQPCPTAVSNPLDMQNKLARLMVLSEVERALLPTNLQLALALISTEGLPTPALVPAGASAPNSTVATTHAHTLTSTPSSTSAPALAPVPVFGHALSDDTHAASPTTTTLPAPVPLVPTPPPPPVTAASSSAMPVSRRATKARTINKIEPGPATLQIDEDLLTDLSSDPELPEEERNANGKKKGKGQTASGRGRGHGRGRGRGHGRSSGQPELANNVESNPAPTTTRRLRSKK